MLRKQTFETNIYMKLFRWAYIFLMSSLCVTLTVTPFFLAVVSLAIDSQNILPFAISLLFFGSAVGAAMSVADGFKQEHDVAPVRQFFSAYRCLGWRHLLFWLPGWLGSIVAAVDIFFFAKIANGQWMIPFFILLAVSGIGLSINCWYFQVKNPKASIKDIFRISIYYVFRKWYISLLNVLVFLLIPLVMLLKPQFGFIITPSVFIGLIYLNASRLHKDTQTDVSKS